MGDPETLGHTFRVLPKRYVSGRRHADFVEELFDARSALAPAQPEELSEVMEELAPRHVIVEVRLLGQIADLALRISIADGLSEDFGLALRREDEPHE